MGNSSQCHCYESSMGSYCDGTCIEKEKARIENDLCCPKCGGDLKDNPSWVNNQLGNPWKCKKCRSTFCFWQIEKSFKGK